MGEKTAIEWADHTFNPWWGCAEVSPACDNCYARTWAERFGHELWGVDAPRRFFGSDHWEQPRRLDRKAGKRGVRERVFCASMADVFDNHPSVAGSRARLWDLIRETPNLDWLLLTKRIGNATRMLPPDWGDGYPNVWLGISVVNQAEVARDIPKLRQIPARVRFLSCEPLLECVWLDLAGIHWVIVGGESGRKARPMLETWVLGIREQCVRNGIAFFMKQWSEAKVARFKDFESFNPVLQVRQWPTHEGVAR